MKILRHSVSEFSRLSSDITQQYYIANLLSSEETSKVAATHLALSAVSHFLAKNPSGQEPTAEQLTSYVQSILPEGTELPDALPVAIGEVCVFPAPNAFEF